MANLVYNEKNPRVQSWRLRQVIRKLSGIVLVRFFTADKDIHDTGYFIQKGFKGLTVTPGWGGLIITAESQRDILYGGRQERNEKQAKGLSSYRSISSCETFTITRTVWGKLSP